MTMQSTLIISVVKQSGYTDCGLFAIAISTALAHGLHPTGLHFRHEDMRSHLCECLEKKATPFPILSQYPGPHIYTLLTV